MQHNKATNSARLRDRRRRKRRHARQLESRMKNEYEEYYKKMNNYEYDTWLSQVTATEEDDPVYGTQQKKKDNMLRDLVKKEKYNKTVEVEYDIIINDEVTSIDENCLIM